MLFLMHMHIFLFMIDDTLVLYQLCQRERYNTNQITPKVKEEFKKLIDKLFYTKMVGDSDRKLFSS